LVGEMWAVIKPPTSKSFRFIRLILRDG
jgi:hypothetical protein